MLKQPEDQMALDGQDAVITCQAEGAPLPNTTWFFNSDEIVETPHYHIHPNGDLQINGISSNDVGNYTCYRANEAGFVSGTASLKVLVKTRIVTAPVDTQVVLGHVATFQCEVGSASSVDLQINWFHDGVAVDPSSAQVNLLNEGTVLEIQQVRATNGGTYTCEIVSRGGNDSKSATLEVMDLPYPPRLVKGERIVGVAKTAKVSWTPNFDGNSPIIKYIVRKRESDATGKIVEYYFYIPIIMNFFSLAIENDFDLNWEVALANVSAGTTSVHVGDLRPSTGYQFKVSAVNNVGEGLSSSPSDVLILPQEAPSGPPQGLVGSPRSSSEIMIQWEPPKEDERNGIVLGYLVRYRLWGYKDSTWYFRNITKEVSFLFQ